MKKQILVAACGLFLTMGIAAQDRVIVVHEAPPPPRHEEMPAPPSEHSDWSWHPGYYQWNGNAYEWVSGKYEQSPRPHDTWVAGHWVNRDGGWVWVEGHWSQSE
jgi:WXXGXW repeat (2 copies)